METSNVLFTATNSMLQLVCCQGRGIQTGKTNVVKTRKHYVPVNTKFNTKISAKIEFQLILNLFQVKCEN